MNLQVWKNDMTAILLDSHGRCCQNAMLNIKVGKSVNIFLHPVKVCNESQMQNFQIKILHGIIACTHWKN